MNVLVISDICMYNQIECIAEYDSNKKKWNGEAIFMKCIHICAISLTYYCKFQTICSQSVLPSIVRSLNFVMSPPKRNKTENITNAFVC